MSNTDIHGKCRGRLHTRDIKSKKCKLCGEDFVTCSTGISICKSCLYANNLCYECGQPLN